MDKLLAEILNELKYQTRLLETLFETKRANGTEDPMEKVMNMIIKMPFIAKMGVDPQDLKNAIIGDGKQGK